MKVLFVCLGNICRSPTAEAVFSDRVKKAGLTDQIHVDSCGTINHHEGEPADPRMIVHGKKRGYDLTSIARGIRKSDLDEFDHILTMDDSNYSNVLALSNDSNAHKVKKMAGYCEKFDLAQVPDPYYGGPDGFELVLDLLEDACDNLLEEVKKDLN